MPPFRVLSGKPLIGQGNIAIPRAASRKTRPVTALAALVSELEELSPYRVYGRVTAVLGMLVEVGGASTSLSVGDRCE